jgi:hypothetical protein
MNLDTFSKMTFRAAGFGEKLPTEVNLLNIPVS